MFKLLVTIIACSFAVYIDADEMRDPTIPLGGQINPTAELNAKTIELHSILFGENRRLAVINGNVMKEKESIGGIEVISIFADRVIVRVNGIESKLTLYKPLRE